MSSRALPSRPSRSNAWRKCRWNSCSAVKPMPPSTCWQCRAVVIAAWPAAALASSELSSSSASIKVATAPSIPTSVSASRCRTAWNEASGRPNCHRSSACWQASANIARLVPTSHHPSARRPAASGTGSPTPVRAMGNSLSSAPTLPASPRSHTTHEAPAYGNGTVAPARCPAEFSTTSLITGAWDPVSPSSRNTMGIAKSGISSSMSRQPRSTRALSSLRPAAVIIAARSASSSRLSDASSRSGFDIIPSPDVEAGAR